MRMRESTWPVRYVPGGVFDALFPTRVRFRSVIEKVQKEKVGLGVNGVRIMNILAFPL